METTKTYPNGTTKEQWDQYYVRLKEHEDRMEGSKPHPENYGWTVHYGWPHVVALTLYEEDLREWNKVYSMDAPNKPGYYRANND